MPGVANQQMITRAESEAKAKHRRRLLKQKVRRGEVLKLINKGFERYERRQRDRRWYRRIARFGANVVAPLLARARGETLIERD